MKKNLLITILSMSMSLALGAQVSTTPMSWHQSGSTKWNAHSRLAPSQLDLAENQKILGHYDSDQLSDQGLGMTSTTGVLPIGVIMEPNELEVFQGGKIVAFRVGLAESTPVSRVFVIPVDATGKYGTVTEWPCSVNAAGWNVINLDTPFEINTGEGGKLMIGFDYEQTANNHPISAVNEGQAYDAYVYTKTSPRAYQWKEIGLIDYGNLSVQCVVESDHFPDYLIEIENLSASNYAKAGNNLDFSFNVTNKGAKRIDPHALVANVLIDGIAVATIDNQEAIVSSHHNVSGNVSTDGLASGEHTLTVITYSLNGEKIETPQSLQTQFVVYANSFPRQKHLVEQLTSTYCTYCPLGSSMLKILTSQRDDVIWVGLHGNLGSGVDPFRSDQCDTILTYLTGGYISYPSGVFNRSTGWNDDTSIANSIGYYEQHHQAVANELGNFFDYLNEVTPNFATINGECQNDYGKVTVSIYGNLTPDFDIMMGSDAKLNVYLVEDSLVASQLNLGTWIDDYEHNGVFRCALGSVFGVPLNKVGDERYSNTFEFDIPEEIENPLNVRVIAFISRPLSNARYGFTDMYVTNAEVFKMELANGIEEALINSDAHPVAYFDVMGRIWSTPQQGINIVKMSDGSVKKVLVK